MDTLVVVTATAPTPNGSLHVGHLSGPFIAADVAARAARVRGQRTLTVSGLDPHQNHVLAMAAKEARTPEAMLDEYEELVRRSLRLAGVGYDVFADPRATPGTGTWWPGCWPSLPPPVRSRSSRLPWPAARPAARCCTTPTFLATAPGAAPGPAAAPARPAGRSPRRPTCPARAAPAAAGRRRT